MEKLSLHFFKIEGPFQSKLEDTGQVCDIFGTYYQTLIITCFCCNYGLEKVYDNNNTWAGVSHELMR